jgi:uncharacterized DUF497 family protein
MDVKRLLSFLSSLEGFDWDEGNTGKNLKYGVEQLEVVQVFFNPPSVLLSDLKHSSYEHRWKLFGKTFDGRLLVIVFLKRKHVSIEEETQKGASIQEPRP